MPEGYRKNALRNHKGEIILPQTTASMVSEESERRFVDNIEKTILNKLATEENRVNELITNADDLSAMSKVSDELILLADVMPDDLYKWTTNMKVLERLIPFVDPIILGIGSSPRVLSTDTGIYYELFINDEDPDNPKLIIRPTDTVNIVSQPENYFRGDRWTVPSNAPDVKIRIPLSNLNYSIDKSVVLTRNNILNESSSSPEDFENIKNGIEGIFYNSADANSLAQISLNFKLDEYLREVVGKGLENSFKRLKITLQEQTKTAGKKSRTQLYFNGNPSMPVRETSLDGTYEEIEFSHLSWVTNIDSDFMQDITNQSGEITLVAYSEKGDGLSITNPELTVYIENPYKGQTVIAQKDKLGDFSILDWALATEDEDRNYRSVGGAVTDGTQL